VNDWGLGWLRAMKLPAPPTEPVRTPRIETPAHLRHTVPLVTGVAPAQLPKNETLADLQRYDFGCHGLCMGDACPTCAALADEIGAARLERDLDRLRAREADLMQQINALREG
jgi:hypothetical protein